MWWCSSRFIVITPSTTTTTPTTSTTFTTTTGTCPWTVATDCPHPLTTWHRGQWVPPAPKTPRGAGPSSCRPAPSSSHRRGARVPASGGSDATWPERSGTKPVPGKIGKDGVSVCVVESVGEVQLELYSLCISVLFTGVHWKNLIPPNHQRFLSLL